MHRFLAFLLFALPLAAKATDTNLVRNGGFEVDGDWAFSVNGASAFGQVTTNEAHSGARSFLLSNHSGFAPNVYARVTQIVRGLEPFTTYRISCFAKGTNSGIVWIGGGPGWYLRAAFPKGTFGWTNISINYTTDETPPDFELMVLSESQTEAVWVDDVRMEPTAADSPRRDAVLARAKTQWDAAHARFSALQARVQSDRRARADAVAQLGLAVTERYLERTRSGGTGASLQGGAWTRLQLEELPVVIDETERRIEAIDRMQAPDPKQPWPALKPA